MNITNMGDIAILRLRDWHQWGRPEHSSPWMCGSPEDVVSPFLIDSWGSVWLQGNSPLLNHYQFSRTACPSVVLRLRVPVIGSFRLLMFCIAVWYASFPAIPGIRAPPDSAGRGKIPKEENQWGCFSSLRKANWKQNPKLDIGNGTAAHQVCTQGGVWYPRCKGQRAKGMRELHKFIHCIHWVCPNTVEKNVSSFLPLVSGPHTSG